MKLKKTKWTPQQCLDAADTGLLGRSGILAGVRLVNVDEKDLYTNYPLPGATLKDTVCFW